MSDTALPETFLHLITTLEATDEGGRVTLALNEAPFPQPKENQVVVQVEATPINPSDLGVLFGYADTSQATASGSGTEATLSVPVSKQGMAMMKGRIGQALTAGNEGAGMVVAAGSSDAAQALLDQRVATMGGGMYGQYRIAEAAMCLPLGEHSAREGASCFVNPLTALSFVETMRMEGHSALVHTAAASNLGQMLVRICQADNVPLVNIVRRTEQAELLRGLGAEHVVNSADEDFAAQLTDAIDTTGATLGFDATGGGTLANDILLAMEAAAARTPGAYSIYGSTHHKQVYLYGSLNFNPTTLNRGYGMAWGVGGWLLPNFMAKAGPEVHMRLNMRVLAELTTTFASQYAEEISLTDMMNPDMLAVYGVRSTGKKYLVNPQLGL